MKLVLITAIAEFGQDIKKMLKEAKVKSYSYRDVKGFRDASEEGVETNWFGTEMNETESIVFYAFVSKENVSILFDLMKEFNDKQGSISHVHLAVFSVEQYN